jgi:predicted ribosome quality control (RQC) complex YloA/Tae2 family protein
LHNNYFFLRHLSKALEDILQNAIISECFSQSKEELIVRFETKNGSFFIKASLVPEFTCLSFPAEFSRAKKNSIDLFGILIGQRVLSVRQFDNERSFSIILSGDLALLFKMHGNRSNIILLSEGKITELFKKNVKADYNLKPESFDRTIDWSYECFLRNIDHPEKIYFTFGKIVWKYLDLVGFNTLSPESQWKLITDTQEKLLEGIFLITEIDQEPVFSLLEIGVIVKQHSNPIKALNDFYYTFTQVFALVKEKNAFSSALASKLQSSRSYYKKTFSKLAELEQDTSYKVWADLIMANLHNLKTGMEKAVLSNFYNQDHPIEIKLKRDSSPQKTAELYYKKSKNQQIEAEHLQNVLFSKEKEISSIETLLETISNTNDLKTLRKLKAEVIETLPAEKDAATLPYHEFFHNGFRIWVGKNAQANDILTLKFGFKEDLWLHAKDVAGSHVLIKHQAGKSFPKDVIQRAAELAAWNSKRKNETLCPVIVTPKKYVRKRKGEPAGAVVVEREDVIMVEPRLTDRRQ